MPPGVSRGQRFQSVLARDSSVAIAILRFFRFSPLVQVHKKDPFIQLGRRGTKRASRGSTRISSWSAPALAERAEPPGHTYCWLLTVPAVTFYFNPSRATTCRPTARDVSQVKLAGGIRRMVTGDGFQPLTISRCRSILGTCPALSPYLYCFYYTSRIPPASPCM